MTLPETASSRWSTTEGLPFPLGPTRIEEEDACNFALYSKHAESVTLLVYTERDIVDPVFEYQFDYLKNKTGRMRGASYYAYRVHGPPPNGRFEWHCFDRDKILLDPYAKSVLFAYRLLSTGSPPPALVRTPAWRPWVSLPATASASTEGDHRPRHEAGTVIYELHVGGFTRNPNSGVRDEACGTFAGLVEKIPYLKDLGVTVVELLPVFQYDPSGGNYGGYMPLNFPLCQTAVRQLHHAN